MKWRAEFELFRAGYEVIQWQNKLLLLGTVVFCCLFGKSWVSRPGRMLTINELSWLIQHCVFITKSEEEEDEFGWLG